jgi:O-antigen ligase
MNKELESNFTAGFIKSYTLEQPGKIYFMFLVLLLGAGAIFSKFLISLSIFLLVLTLVFVLDRQEDGKLKLMMRKINLKQLFRKLIKPSFYLFILLFLATLISALLSEDIANGLAKVQLRLPYFLLPFVFVFNKPFNRDEVFMLFYSFAILCSLVTIGVLINYGLNFELVTESLAHGKSVLTPSNHIRYSLFLAFTSLASLYIYLQGVFSRRENILLLVIAIFIAASLHILAVRSGLFLFYIGVVYLFLSDLIKRFSTKWAISLLLILMTFPFIAYQFIPSLENRIDYMLYDLKLYVSGDTSGYSDGDRLRSISMGWALFKESPLLGCGVGDIQQATEEVYKAHYDDSVNVRQPHNQLIYFLASSGLLGALLCFPALFFPYFMNNGKEKNLIYLHGIVFLLSCLIEATIEGTNGICFHLFFLLPLMSLNRGEME